MERYIPELGKTLTGELLAIWDGRTTNKTPEQCQQYRNKWLAEAQEQLKMKQFDFNKLLQNKACGCSKRKDLPF
jgi:hypothetical protein